MISSQLFVSRLFTSRLSVSCLRDLRFSWCTAVHAYVCQCRSVYCTIVEHDSHSTSDPTSAVLSTISYAPSRYIGITPEGGAARAAIIFSQPVEAKSERVTADCKAVLTAARIRNLAPNVYTTALLHEGEHARFFKVRSVSPRGRSCASLQSTRHFHTSLYVTHVSVRYTCLCALHMSLCVTCPCVT